MELLLLLLIMVGVASTAVHYMKGLINGQQDILFYISLAATIVLSVVGYSTYW